MRCFDTVDGGSGVADGSWWPLRSYAHNSRPNVMIVECTKAGQVYNVTASIDCSLIAKECGSVLAFLVDSRYRITHVTPVSGGSVVY